MNKKRIKNILYRIIQKEMAFCELENMPNKKRVQLCNDYGTRSCLGCSTCCVNK